MKKKLLELLLAAIMVVSMLTAMSLSAAATDTAFPYLTNVSLNIYDETKADHNGDSLINDKKVSVSDKINVTYSFKISEAVELHLNTSYTFSLPEQLLCNTTEVPFVAGLIKVGTVTVDGTEARIEFNEASGLEDDPYALMEASGSFQISQVCFNQSKVTAGGGGNAELRPN